MLTRLTRLEVDGFRSLHGVVLCPRKLEVVLDAGGTATRDLVALFTLLKELAEGRLQQHLSPQDVLNGECVRLTVEVDSNPYWLELRRCPDGLWRVAREEFFFWQGLGVLFIDPEKDPPREEATLSTRVDPALEPTPPAGEDDSDKEGRYLGTVISGCLWTLRQFLRGFRVQPAGAFDPAAAGSFLFLEDPGLELAAESLGVRVQSAREASAHSQVLLCTPSTFLADAFAREEVIRADTSEGVSRFLPLVPRQDG